MLGNDLRRILNGIARLLIGTCFLENMRGQNIPDVMWAVRKQALDRATPGVGIVDPVSLDGQTPGLIETRLTIGCILTRRAARGDAHGHRHLYNGRVHQDQATRIGMACSGKRMRWHS